MPSDAYNSITFTGQFRHGVDTKNRLTIPADWRSGEEGVLYVRIHSTGSHLTVLPPDQLRKTVAAIEARKDKTVAEQQKLIRMVSAGAHRCCVDKQGRMVLPPEFCLKAELQGEVMLVGGFGQFEIWNTERWAAEQSADEVESRDLANELGL
jgi:MraZ protein